MKKTLTGFAFVILATELAADPTLECSGDTTTQVEIGTCLTATEKTVDQSIQTALSIARQSAQSLDEVTGRAASLPALNTAQTNWEAYRSAQCDFVGTTFGGGSGTGIAISACLIDLGRLRVDALLRYAQ